MEHEYSTGRPRRSIQIYDWSVSILYHKVSPRKNEVPHALLVGKPQNNYLYKTALSRRLLRFHQPGYVVYVQTMESF